MVTILIKTNKHVYSSYLMQYIHRINYPFASHTFDTSIMIILSSSKP